MKAKAILEGAQLAPGPKHIRDAPVVALTLLLLVVGCFLRSVPSCSDAANVINSMPNVGRQGGRGAHTEAPVPRTFCTTVPLELQFDLKHHLQQHTSSSTRFGLRPVLTLARIARHAPAMYVAALRLLGTDDAWIAVHAAWCTLFMATALLAPMAGVQGAAVYARVLRPAFSVGCRLLPGLVSFAASLASGRTNTFFIAFFVHSAAWNLWYPLVLQVGRRWEHRQQCLDREGGGGPGRATPRAAQGGIVPSKCWMQLPAQAHSILPHAPVNVPPALTMLGSR